MGSADFKDGAAARRLLASEALPAAAAGPHCRSLLRSINTSSDATGSAPCSTQSTEPLAPLSAELGDERRSEPIGSIELSEPAESSESCRQPGGHLLGDASSGADGGGKQSWLGDAPHAVVGDAPSEVASDAPSGVSSDQPRDLPSKIASDLPSEMPRDLPSEVASGAPGDALRDRVGDASGGAGFGTFSASRPNPGTRRPARSTTRRPSFMTMLQPKIRPGRQPSKADSEQPPATITPGPAFGGSRRPVRRAALPPPKAARSEPPRKSEDAGRRCSAQASSSQVWSAEGTNLASIARWYQNLPADSPLAKRGFANLIESLRRGDSEVLTMVIQQYSEWLRITIRRSIHPRVRQRFDSSDFVQSTWASMISQRERLPNLADATELGRYLVRITFHKVHDANRQAILTKKRDMRRECGLADLEHTPGGQAVISDRRQPRPSEIFRARERLDRIRMVLDRYPERMREIPQRRAQGESFEQIAANIGVHERTVRRFLAKLLEELRRDN